MKKNKMLPTIALMGTCNGSTWRDELIPKLNIKYYNPVVENWTPECQEEEIRQREICDFLLYVITPKMTGVFAIAELVQDSNKRPEKTIFCFLEKDGNVQFGEHQIKSLNAVARMVEENGSFVFLDLDDVALYLNSFNLPQ